MIASHQRSDVVHSRHVSLGDLLALERRPVQVHADRLYAEIGVRSFGRGIFHKPARLGNEIGDKSLYLVKDRDFIFQITFAWEGAVALASSSEDGMYASHRFPTFRVDEGVCSPEYLRYFFRTEAGRSQLERISPGSAGRNRVLNLKRLHEVRIPLPALSEQHRIVDLLDAGDELRQKAAAAQERALRILPTLFVQMFGDPATNPKGWKRTTLGEVLLSAQYGLSQAASADRRGVPILRMNNIDPQGYLSLHDLKFVEISASELAKYRLERGDLLFNRTNSVELVGKTGLWQSDMEVVPASYLIRLKVDREKAIPEYVWMAMNTPYMKQALARTARRAIGMANINAQELRALPLLLPNAHQRRTFDILQYAFAQRLALISAIRERYEELGQKLDRLFNVLQHGAFSGELTAGWRAAHTGELAAEIAEQDRLLKQGQGRLWPEDGTC